MGAMTGRLVVSSATLAFAVMAVAYALAGTPGCDRWSRHKDAQHRAWWLSECARHRPLTECRADYEALEAQEGVR